MLITLQMYWIWLELKVNNDDGFQDDQGDMVPLCHLSIRWDVGQHLFTVKLIKWQRYVWQIIHKIKK